MHDLQRADDPSTHATVKKPATQSSQDRRPPQQQLEEKDKTDDLIPHKALIDAGGVAVFSDEASGEGVFHFLGGGKAVKGGFVTVSCSGYDPTKKRPEDLVAGEQEPSLTLP